MITVLMDVTDRPIAEVEYMHNVRGCDFPCDNGKCVRWYAERSKKDEARKTCKAQ